MRLLPRPPVVQAGHRFPASRAPAFALRIGVALNSVFQVITYSFFGWLFLTVVPGWFGAQTAVVDVSMWTIAKSVLIFLGIPLLAGYLTRRVLVARRGEARYMGTFMPKFGPTALVGLLYTIVLMFAMQGDRILQLPLDVLRIAMPLLVYLFVMFSLAFVLSKKLGFDYQSTAYVPEGVGDTTAAGDVLRHLVEQSRVASTQAYRQAAQAAVLTVGLR